MAELKPCPCCGGKAKTIARTYIDENGYEDILCWHTWCSECGLATRGFAGAGEAEEAWNRRVDNG